MTLYLRRLITFSCYCTFLNVSLLFNKPLLILLVPGLSTSSLDKHDTTSQMLDANVYSGTTLTPQQQVMSAMNSLNLGNLLPQQPQQPNAPMPTAQTTPNLLPLIQKFLAGDFMSNRSGEDKLSLEQAQMAQAQRTSMALHSQTQPTGTSLALNQVSIFIRCSKLFVSGF